jgi:DNA-binding LacI/PurR family transcriptional regulator/DNA-binding transcriptional regulator YhcF (GntR family)
MNSLLEPYTPIDRKEQLPINSQLTSKLESLLRDKRLKTGDKFPSIRQIAEHFKISQITAQQTINELAMKKYIVKRQGHGCFVGNIKKMPERRPCLRVSTPVCKPSGNDDFTQHISNMLAGSTAGLSESGFSINFIDCKKDGSEFLDICNLYRNGLTDGAILLGSLPNMERNLKEADAISMPTILINKFDPNVCNVISDIKKASMQMTEHLTDLGMKNFAVYTIESQSPRFKDIINGVSESLESKDLHLDRNQVKYFNEYGICLEDTSKEIVQTLKEKNVPDVIFCSPETLTLVAAEALRTTNNTKTALVSVGNAADGYSFFSNREVMRIKVPYFEMGRRAGLHIAECIMNGTTPQKEQIKIDCAITK